MIINSDWNLRAAADNMFFHYNTVRNKYQKILDLLKLREVSAEQKFKLSLACRLRHILDRMGLKGKND